ncbi:MAG: tail protein X [Christensenellales bacterium]|jgi:phage tail protein X
MSQKEVGRSEYLTRQGDMFDAIALYFYSEERMASYIIAANPDHCDVIIFDAGVKLSIPILEAVETVDTLPPWRR